MADRIPTGFELPENLDESDGRAGEVILDQIGDDFDAIPCTLYTDYYGANYFVIVRNGLKYVLPVGTD